MGKHRSTFAQKVAWMVSHPNLWRGWPSCIVTDDQIKKMMVKDGLISRSSNSYDIMDFGKLVMAARQVIKGKI